MQYGKSQYPDKTSCARHHVWLLHEQYDLNLYPKKLRMVQWVKVLLHTCGYLNSMASTQVNRQVWLRHICNAGRQVWCHAHL